MYRNYLKYGAISIKGELQINATKLPPKILIAAVDQVIVPSLNAFDCWPLTVGFLAKPQRPTTNMLLIMQVTVTGTGGIHGTLCG